MAEILEILSPVVSDGETINETHFEVLRAKINEIVRKVNENPSPSNKMRIVFNPTDSDPARLKCRFTSSNADVIPSAKLIKGNIYDSDNNLLFSEGETFSLDKASRGNTLLKIVYGEETIIEITDYQALDDFYINVPNTTINGVQFAELGLASLTSMPKIDAIDIKYAGSFNENLEDVALAYDKVRTYPTNHSYVKITTRANGLKLNGAVQAASSNTLFYLHLSQDASSILIGTATTTDSEVVATYNKSTHTWSY